MTSDIRKTRTCEKCKTVVLLDKVRLYPKDSETNLLVCESCCESLKAGIRPDLPGKNKTIINSPRASALTSVSQSSIAKMKAEPASEIYIGSQSSSKMKIDHKKNISDRTISQLPSPDYSQYRCIRCNYFFKVDRSKVGITTNMSCPYCGRADKIERAKSE